MKIYEYKCEDCGDIFELFKNGSEKLICKSCGSENIKRIFSTPILAKEHFNYGGKTCCNRNEMCSTPPCCQDGTCLR